MRLQENEKEIYRFLWNGPTAACPVGRLAGCRNNYVKEKKRKKKERHSEYTEPLLCVMSIVNKPFTRSSGVSWGRFKFLFDRHSKTLYDYEGKRKIHRVTSSCSILNRPIVSDILTMHDINKPKSNRLTMSARFLSNLPPYKSWRIGSIALHSIRESSKKKREREFHKTPVIIRFLNRMQRSYRSKPSYTISNFSGSFKRSEQ